METKLCKRGHKMTRVGRGDKKRWVCNKCRAEARRVSGAGRRARRMSYDASWSVSSFAAGPGTPTVESPAVNMSYYDRPEIGEEESR
jgi:hypothetical protein